MNLILTGTVESISTRADKTLKVVIGTQELDNNDAGKLVSFRNQFTKLLLSTDEITLEVEGKVNKLPLKDDGKKYSRSQLLRFAIYKLHQAQNEPIEFEKFYDQTMASLIINIENEAYELIEQSK